MDLERAYREARNHRSALEIERGTERRSRLDEFTAALDADLDKKYQEQIGQARETEARAEEAWNRHREAEAQERQHPYPLGTVLVEWEYPERLYRTALPTDRRWTGRKGVLEVVTADSEHPANWGSWKCADRGDLVIRILKKDGKPSRMYIKASERYYRDYWVPEGADLLQPDLGWPEGKVQP